jgi:hypothetical protein
MAVSLTALRAGRPLPLGRFLVLISVRVWVNPRAIKRLEGLSELKNPMISSGIETATFRFVAWCLKQLHYRGPYLRILDRLLTFRRNILPPSSRSKNKPNREAVSRLPPSSGSYSRPQAKQPARWHQGQQYSSHSLSWELQMTQAVSHYSIYLLFVITLVTSKVKP